VWIRLTCTHQFIQKVQYQNYAEHARPDIRNTEDELARTLEYSLDVVPKTGERVVSDGFIGNVGVQHVSLNMDFASEKTEENVTIITVWELVLGGMRERRIQIQSGETEGHLPQDGTSANGILGDTWLDR
jgi:hypothetical protein